MRSASLSFRCLFFSKRQGTPEREREGERERETEWGGVGRRDEGREEHGQADRHTGRQTDRDGKTDRQIETRDILREVLLYRISCSSFRDGRPHLLLPWMHKFPRGGE